MKLRNLGLAITASLLLSASVFAAEATTTFGVSATVEAACSVTATPMAFGSFSAFAGQQDVTSTVSVTCSNSTAYDVGLDAGDGTGATVGNRLMTHTDATSTLGYALFSDALRTDNWGNTVDTDTVADIGSGLEQDHTVYGRVTDPTLAIVGAFADTVTVTVTY